VTTPSPTPPAAAPTAPTAAKDQGAGGSSVQRPLGYIVAGLGAVGVGVGAIFGLEAKSKNDDSVAQCRTDTLCSQAGYDLRQQALDAATYSTVAFSLGAAALVGGIVLIVTAPSTSTTPATQPQAAWSLGPTFTSSSGSLTVRGAF
jgi:serine/threonine-protein kinase